MGKICTFCKYKRPENRCALIFSNASVKQTERCWNYEPVEDVAPVVHAHWVEDDDGVHCSECKKDAPLEVFTYSFNPTTDSWDGDVKFNKSEFCPHCGAKMDEEVG